MFLLSILHKSGLRGKRVKHGGFHDSFENMKFSGQIYFDHFSFHRHKAYSEIHIDQNNNIVSWFWLKQNPFCFSESSLQLSSSQ